MTEEPINLVLEHLRAIRGDIGKINERLDAVVMRLGSLEHKVAYIALDIARIDGHLDSMDKRIERIEKRLDLVEA